MKVLAHCIDSAYLDEIDALILLLNLSSGVKRVLPIFRSDCCYKDNPECPVEEIKKTGEMWKNKSFYLEIEDQEDIDKNLFETEKSLLGEVGSQLMESVEKMTTDEWIFKFKQSDLFRRIRREQRCGHPNIPSES